MFSLTCSTFRERPLPDFQSSMHADIDCLGSDGSLKRRSTETARVTSKSLIKTRRLLYWSYQVWTEIGKTEVQRN